LSARREVDVVAVQLECCWQQAAAAAPASSVGVKNEGQQAPGSSRARSWLGASEARQTGHKKLTFFVKKNVKSYPIAGHDDPVPV
jgi:hypothetical protein